MLGHCVKIRLLYGHQNNRIVYGVSSTGRHVRSKGKRRLFYFTESFIIERVPVH